MPNVRLQDRLDAEVFALDMAGLRGLAVRVFAELPAVGLRAHRLHPPILPLEPLYPIAIWHDSAADLLAAWRAA